MIFIDRDVERENFALNFYHRWPRKPPLWFCGVVASLACSAGAVVLLVLGR